MADQDLDRSEAATPFKLQKARDRGQAPRSADVASSLVLVVAMVFVAWRGEAEVRSVLELARGALAQIGPAGEDAAWLWPVAAGLVRAALGALLPFLLVVVVAAVAGNLVQTGFLFSLEPLHADFSRVSPATGLKRLFSLRTLFDGLRAVLKLAVLCTTAWLALRALLPQFHGIAALSPAGFLHTLVEDGGHLGLRMAVALAVLALLDVLYTRAEFQRRMRMSRRELKDEYKSREGDPRIRARLRELRREMLRRSQSLKNTRTADVVLTNPTHYAVALRYVHGEMDAPRVVAKGAGKLAAAMREIAARHRVVVVQNPPLARRLFREAALDASLPASFHAEVARIIVWVFAMRRQQQARIAGGAA